MPLLADVAYRSLTGTAFPERWLADLHLPEANTGDCLIWIHGGGLTSGDKSDAAISVPLVAAGWAVVCTNHRFLHQAAWPACLEDIASVTAWVRGALAVQGFTCRRLFIGGVSAGAYLATMVALDRRWLAAQDLDASSLAGVIALSGQMTSHFAYRAAIGHPETQPLLDHAAPLWHVHAAAPPLLLIVGSDDLPCRPEENHYMAAAMRSVGHLTTTCHVIAGRTHATIGEALDDPHNPVTRLLHDFLQVSADR